MTDQLSTAQEFVEVMGMHFQSYRMPRIAGRLFGLLLIEGGPFSFSELAERLQVSRASISTNARTLQALGLIERVAKPGDRQDHYKIDANGLIAMQRQEIQKLSEIHRWYRETAAKLGPTHAGAVQRLEIAALISEAAVKGMVQGLSGAEDILAQVGQKD
ncbi:GbsR/MarR family transcriptional regulator [Paracoccus aminophilus]|uniref:Transcriptional regulator, MarR family n=1 Tax=Paracoccus aminophilus JCM 7686 TaxID=1367847 RepID=S5XMT3_PARAH|nr:MarR family transcriptional regulator [Paracoccus aminophilus]AGT08569.1 transcriptional regulator, MarR family [Paracoccus aminophilus JCM 7686]